MGISDRRRPTPNPQPLCIEETEVAADDVTQGPNETAAPGGGVPRGDNRISIEEFMKVDLRVVRVIAAERVPKSRKLIKLEVDLGTERRTLVAGIAETYEPEALVGRTLAMVANLQPANSRARAWRAGRR